MTIAKTCMASVLAAVAMFSAPAFPATSGPVTAEESIEALTASYAYADGHRLDPQGRRVVIARYGRYIVVSFLGHEDEKGGSSHIVYDPASKGVVDYRVEE